MVEIFTFLCYNHYVTSDAKVYTGMNENILSAFKNELGYVDATNQYVELSVRMTEKDYGSVLKSDLRELAQSVNLNVSSLAEDYMCRISKSYIVNVNSCLGESISFSVCFTLLAYISSIILSVILSLLLPTLT